MRQKYQISEQFPSRDEEEALGFSIFAQKDYWLLHLPKEKIVPISIRNYQNKIICYWCFYHAEEKLVTPFNAPFFAPYTESNKMEVELFSAIIDFCKRKYQLSMEIKLNANSLLHRLQITNIIFQIRNVELGAKILVTSDDFIEVIHRKRKRQKLRSLLNENIFTVAKVEDHEWERVYGQNLKWRKGKAHQSYISTTGMLQAKREFPERYHAFQLKKDGVPVGTCFFLIVDAELIYVYSLITAPTFDSAEPALLLWNAIYDYAKSIQSSIIDMGTSMFPEGGINRNLADYKQFVGGSYYRRYTIKC